MQELLGHQDVTTTLIALLGAVGCSRWPPERPPRVPVEAAWLGPAERPAETGKGALGWVSCQDSHPNAYDCVLFAYPAGKEVARGRFLLISDLPCNCPVNTVDPRFRRVLARGLQFRSYDATRNRITLVANDALLGPL